MISEAATDNPFMTVTQAWPAILGRFSVLEIMIRFVNSDLNVFAGPYYLLDVTRMSFTLEQ